MNKLIISISENNSVAVTIYKDKKLMAKDSWDHGKNLDERLIVGIDKILKRVNMKITGLDKVEFLSKSNSFTANLICGIVVDILNFARKFYF